MNTERELAVVGVPAKLAAGVRLVDTGNNRKTDALNAHSIAVVAVRTDGLRMLVEDGELEALRMLTDRRDELAHQRLQTVNRLQRLLTELLFGQRKCDLSATQAKATLATVRPRDIAGRTRRRMAAEKVADLVALDDRLKRIKAELKSAVLERGSHLMDVYGIGPAGAARVLADVGDIARFADRNRFASWTGTELCTAAEQLGLLETNLDPPLLSVGCVRWTFLLRGAHHARGLRHCDRSITPMAPDHRNPRSGIHEEGSTRPLRSYRQSRGHRHQGHSRARR